MDRRVINQNYGKEPMQLFVALSKFCVPNIIGYSAGAPRMLEDRVTIHQRYEECPMNSGVEICYRLSKDGKSILVFDPEMEGSIMYGLDEWTIDQLPDEKANIILEMRDDPFWVIAHMLIGGEKSLPDEEIREILETNAKESQS